MAEVLILGSGVSGLSAGIYSLLEGFCVTICEKHSIAGGNLTGWQRGKYHIDNCIHWLVGTNPNYNGFDDWNTLGAFGNKIDIYQPESLFTVSFDNKEATLYRDINKTRSTLIRKFPIDKDELNKLFDAIEAVQGFQHVRGPKHNEKNNLLQILRSVPQLTRYSQMTVSELAECFNEPVLRHFVSDMVMNKDFTAYFFIVTAAAFCGDNAGIPAGGSKKMADSILERFISLGGNILYGKDACEIITDGNKATEVCFTDGTKIHADFVISAMDVRVLYEDLLGISMPRKLLGLYKDNRYKIFSSFQCAIACDITDLPFNDNVIFNAPSGVVDYVGGRQLIVTEYRRCPEFAPKGHTVLQTLSYCSEKEAKAFIRLKERDIEKYRHIKYKIANELLELIEDKYPDLKGHLKLIDVWTPATYKRYVGSKRGSWMSFSLPSGRVPRVIDNRVKGFDNILVCSQWLQSPGGLPTAVRIGKKTAKQLKKIEKIKTI